ncbi:MAG: AIM24 family protein [Ruminococcus sp.]|nr:AIM24 family protein [Ruminococcus sp.]
MNLNYNAIGTRSNVKVIDSSENKSCHIDILEYQNLNGLTNSSMAQSLFYMKEQNIKAKQIVIYLENDVIKTEPGALSYMQGNIQMVSGVNAGNLIGKMFSSKMTGENIAQPEYKGTGMIVLEPSFKHFVVIDLQANEDIIVDKGMMYACQGSVTSKPMMQKSISSAIAGGEGLFQIYIKGPGLVVLELPVPMEEVDIIQMNNDTLKVDGNFALLRSATMNFTVERSAKSLLGSSVSGEGLVNVYRGTGQVWLAPTIKIYENLTGTTVSATN